MAVRRWAWVIGLALAVALPLGGQQQNQQQQTPSGQQAQPEQQDKRSTQDLPSAPQPQPTAGQKKPEKLPSAPPDEPPSPPPSDPGPYGPAGPSTTSAPPRTTPPDNPGTSSSKEDKVDISPPANDATTHPNAGLDNSDVGEFHPFDPHHAAKDVEVGDFYYKQRNYRAAVSRYREALLYKPNDAIATYRLADALEKSGDLPEAVQNYQAYLKILPYGPRAGEAHQALQRLKSKGAAVRKPAATAAASKHKQ
jgi:tetratricopeptide (TPR) repeat protein